MNAVFPQGWEVVPLESLLVTSRDLTYGVIQPGRHQDDGVPIARVGDIRRGHVDLSNPLRIAPTVESGYARSRIVGGELLVTLVGTVGECAVAPNAMCGWNVARAVAVARVRPDIGARWVARCLEERDSVARIHSRVNTTVQTTLNLQDLRQLPVVLPPKAERSRIADIADALDDKIESNGRTRQVASNLLDALSASLTDSLKTVPLRELVVVERTPLDPKVFADQQVEHFSLPAFDDSARPERVAASVIMSGKLAVSGPSILVSRLNPRFNRTWWAVPTEGVPALASTEFACLTANSPEELAAVWLAVRDEYFRTELVRRASGTSGSHQRVRPDDLLAIDVPDVRELAATTKREALALLHLIHDRRIACGTLAELRDALLPELLSGRIRVPEAREAVAEFVPSV